MAIHVYAGPTLTAGHIRSVLPGAVLHDPVQHGDLLRDRLGRGDCIVLIDGYYHQVGAVRHKEILHVLEAGATVIGAASMGAIRAAEMSGLGMTGIGEVFRQYRDGEITGDDEVAVAHGERPEFRRVSEALVNIRFTLGRARREGVTEPGEAAGLLEHARALHYAERSWATMAQRVRRQDPTLGPALDRVRGYATGHAAELDLKALDAGQALSYVASGQWRAGPGRLGWREPRAWHTRHLHDWQVQHGSQSPGEPVLPDLTIARYLQLHDPQFPARWRSFALGRIAATSVADPDRAALAAAAARGLSSSDLSEAVTAFWLTAAESRRLSRDQALATVLVRSYRSARGLRDIVDAAAVPAVSPGIRRLIAEHHAVNAAVAAKRPRWQLSHLNRAALAAQLAALWNLEVSDQAALDARARDRGFDSFDSAVESFRPFFLKRHLEQSRQAEARP